MANIDTWVRMGKPRTKTWTSSGYKYTLPQSSDKTPWMCDTVAERLATVSDRLAWYELKPGCKGGYEATSGLKYSESAAGFIGTGMKQPADAVVLTPAVPAPQAVPITDPNAGNPPDIVDFITLPFPGEQVGGGPQITFEPMEAAMALPLGISLVGVGSDLLGGAVSSLGGSVCPGPYNYNPATGMCIPKADCKQRQPSDPCVSYPAGGSKVIGTIGPGATGLTDPGYTGGSTGPCPSGYQWDGKQCIATGISGTVQRILPGGQTGTGSDVYGMAVMGSFGRPALQPYVAQQVVRRCPPGTVLGKDGLCYDKIANGDRMWPRGPRPLMTGGDMKVLRKAEALKKKVKRLATSSGFTCRKR